MISARLTYDGGHFSHRYPFGLGERYQKQDETAQFRFVIEER
jgi:hypothetical protein